MRFNPFVQSKFDTGPLITVHVPACKSAQALVFEAFMQGQFAEVANSPETFFNCNYKYTLISNSLPQNISVSLLVGLGAHKSPIDGIRAPLEDRRQRRVTKTLLERKDPRWWAIEDKNGGGPLPLDQVHQILNLLLDNGFDVEISFVTIGTMQGIEDVWFGACALYISQLKKD
jgi:hypothetical protein